MTSMIERVARAICKAQTQGTGFWKAFIPEARAAIAAMREPTPHMYIKGGVAISDVRPQSETYADESFACWAVMIDAALEEKL